MKLFTALLAACFSLTSAIAQFEGKMVMKVEVLNLPPDLESMRSLMETSNTIYLKGTKSRSESYMEMLGSNIVITNTTTGEVINCTEMMGEPLAFKSNYKEELNADDGTNTYFTPKAGTKVIAGYKCDKGVYTFEEEGEIQEMEIWYTKDIPNTLSEMIEVPGFVLEMLFKEGDISLKYHAIEITKQKVPDSLFELPTGYRLLSQEEMNEMYLEEED